MKNRFCLKATVAFVASMLTAIGAQAATVFTGDKVQGVAVISQLDVSDLEPGKTHRFMFQGVEMGTGQHGYVPVMVAKGARSGKRVLLVSGVHGDELNPVRVVQKVFADLDAAKLSGSVIGVLGPSRPGVEHVTRMWPVSNLGLNLINPNRTWPGKETGNKLDDLFAVKSGFTEVLVKLNDTVKKGQKVAIQRNAFGDVIHEYFAGVDGRVAIIGTDAIRERGVDIVSIVSYSSECVAVACPYTGDEP